MTKQPPCRSEITIDAKGNVSFVGGDPFAKIYRGFCGQIVFASEGGIEYTADDLEIILERMRK